MTRIALGLVAVVVTTVVTAAPLRSEGPVVTMVAQTFALPGHRAPEPAGSIASAPARAHGCYSGLPRATTDRPDEGPGSKIHVIYLVPSNGKDERLDVTGTLDCSLRAMNQWFQQQSNNLRWRLDTFPMKAPGPGERTRVDAVDVTYVRSSKPRSQLSSLSDVQTELEGLGFDRPGKRYLSFVAGGDNSGVCGDAAYPVLDTSGRPADGKYSQVYLFSVKACRAHDFGIPGRPSYAEAIALQELIHNDGMTPAGAPHSCAWVPPVAHLCTPGVGIAAAELDPESADVMFPFVSGPLSDKVLDRGNDDYFRFPVPTGYPDLARSRYLTKVG